MTALDHVTARGHRGEAAVDLAGDPFPGPTGGAPLRLLFETVRLRDRSLADHCLRSAHLAAAMAERLGSGTEQVHHAYLAGLLHDIGKLGIPEAILWKPAGLDTAEWQAIRSHPERGHRLVADVVHEDVAAAVLYHHERMDAAGYPFGVRLRSLPLTVRLVQVADAYDALTSDRPYEPAVAPATAVAEIVRCAGTQFDPDAVEALHAVFDGDPAVITVAESPAVHSVTADPFD